MKTLAGIIASMLLICVLFFAQWVGVELPGNNIVAETAVGLLLIISSFAVTFVAVLFLAGIWKFLFETGLWILRAIARIFGGVKCRLHPKDKR